MRGAWLLSALLFLACASTAHGQANIVDGYVSVMADVLPDGDASAGRQPATELRTRLFLERRVDIGSNVRLSLAGYVDGLVADRDVGGTRGATGTVIARPTDLYVEWTTARFDVRAGASRIVWGRLDEFQPSDVVNPLDVTRFLLEGRNEARLSVGLVRGRVFLPYGITVEGVIVPVFVRGRFDQLDEETSPFNVGPRQAVARQTFDLSTSWDNIQGGGRVTGTIGRIDLGASAYRGFEPFPLFTLTPSFELAESFPRFTMVAGDFETTAGPWGIRGEAAFFPEDTLQAGSPAVAPVPARSVEAGGGLDRRAGNYRVSGNVIVSRRWVHREEWAAAPVPFDARIETRDVLLVGWAERSFARETRALRLLAAYNPDAGSVFVRGTAAISVRDNLWLELSAGWLDGTGLDMLSRLSSQDFVYGRVKVHF